MKDTSFTKLFTLKKYKDLYDFRSIECIAAGISVIIMNLIFFIAGKYLGIDTFVNEGISFVDNIGISLIGFLGFIVTGLAILTGAISSKVVKHIQDSKKMSSLEKILLSFYLLGLLSAFEIILIIILHFICILPFPSLRIVDVLTVTVLTYLTVFIIFYAVKLIGNCLELFYIVNDMEIIENSAREMTNKYNHYRILALEKEILSKTSLEEIEIYKNTIIELINRDAISKEEKEIYLDMVKKQFGATGNSKSSFYFDANMIQS